MTRALGITLPAAPAWYGASALALAGATGLLVVGRPAGLGLALVLVAVVLLAPRRDPLWTSLGVALAVMPALRTAGWVVALCALGAVGLTVFRTARATTWGRLFVAPAVWLLGLLPGPFVTAALAARHSSSAAVRGGVLAALLLALFGSLLAAADAAFAQLTDSFVPDLEDGGTRLALAGLVAAALGAFALVAAAEPEAPRARPAPVLGTTETRIALGALALLFAAFVAVQAAALFGGDAFVQRTAGLTYAEYARKGFALLLVVAALTLAVLAAAVRYGRPDRWLGVTLCLLTLVILGAAWHRLGLYTDAYGATRAREFAGWCIVWLAGFFALVIAGRAGVRKVVTWSALLGVVFGFSNPDARIAAGAKDAYYRSTLSDDAGLRCVDRGGGVLSLTLAELRDGC